jgi:hypothetical protein
MARPKKIKVEEIKEVIEPVIKNDIVNKQDIIKSFIDNVRVNRGGNTPQNHLYGLYDLIRYVIDRKGNDITLAEIGSHKGVSSKLFALHFKKVYCIDAWDMVLKNDYTELNKNEIIESEIEFDKMNTEYKNVVKVKNYSVDAAEQFKDDSLDMVYIDSDHRYDYVKKDIEVWSKKVKKGGIISGHDYKNILDVRKAVQDSFKKVEPLLFSDCSWLYIKE